MIDNITAQNINFSFRITLYNVNESHYRPEVPRGITGS